MIFAGRILLLRIDKYLWCVRLFKTRALATEALRLEKVRIQEEPVKPSREVKPGLVFALVRAGIRWEYRVKDLPKNRVGAALVSNYLDDLTSAEEKEKWEFLQMARSLQRPRGEGRPTKKDRRDLDRLTPD